MRNHYFLSVLGLLGSLGLSSCATPHVTPATQQALSPAALAVTQISSPFAANWWQTLGDNSLNQLIDAALRANPTLALADARVRAALAAADSVASNDGLKANGNAGVVRSRTSEFEALPPPMLGKWSTLKQINTDISYRFDFWGKTRALLAAARGQTRAAELEASDSRQSVAYAIVSTYLEWRTAQNAEQLLQQDRQLADALLRQARARWRNGLAQPDEVQQAQAQLAEAEEQQLRAAQRSANAAHALAALSAQPQSHIDALPAAPLPQWQPETSRISTASLGLRADVLAARERIEASRKMVDAAHADFYPDIRLNLLAGLSAQEVGDLFTPGARVLRLAPALTLPIFSNGELNARLDNRSAELDAAIASYNQILLAAIRDTADRSSQLQTLLQAETASSQALLARRNSVKLLKSRLDAGLATPASVLAEHRRLNQAQIQSLNLQGQRLQAQAALIRTLGTAPASAN